MNKKLFTISFYYLDDYYERCSGYLVYATSEKQAKFFLGKDLQISFANSLNQAYLLKNKTNRKIVILTEFRFEELNEIDNHKIGEIINFY